MSMKAFAESMGIMVPVEFLCPISNEIMSTPMMTRDGINFERTAVMQQIRCGNTTCPVTKKSLELSNIVRNIMLEEKIARWRWGNMLPEPPAAENDYFGIIESPTKKSKKAFSFQRIISPSKLSVRSSTTPAA